MQRNKHKYKKGDIINEIRKSASNKKGKKGNKKPLTMDELTDMVAEKAIEDAEEDGEDEDNKKIDLSGLRKKLKSKTHNAENYGLVVPPANIKQNNEEENNNQPDNTQSTIQFPTVQAPSQPISAPSQPTSAPTLQPTTQLSSQSNTQNYLNNLNGSLNRPNPFANTMNNIYSNTAEKMFNPFNVEPVYPNYDANNRGFLNNSVFNPFNSDNFLKRQPTTYDPYSNNSSYMQMQLFNNIIADQQNYLKKIQELQNQNNLLLQQNNELQKPHPSLFSNIVNQPINSVKQTVENLEGNNPNKDSHWVASTLGAATNILPLVMPGGNVVAPIARTVMSQFMPNEESKRAFNTAGVLGQVGANLIDGIGRPIYQGITGDNSSGPLLAKIWDSGKNAISNLFSFNKSQPQVNPISGLLPAPSLNTNNWNGGMYDQPNSTSANFNPYSGAGVKRGRNYTYESRKNGDSDDDSYDGDIYYPSKYRGGAASITPSDYDYYYNLNVPQTRNGYVGNPKYVPGILDVARDKNINNYDPTTLHGNIRGYNKLPEILNNSKNDDNYAEKVRNWSDSVNKFRDDYSHNFIGPMTVDEMANDAINKSSNMHNNVEKIKAISNVALFVVDNFLHQLYKYSKDIGNSVYQYIKNSFNDIILWLVETGIQLLQYLGLNNVKILIDILSFILTIYLYNKGILTVKVVIWVCTLFPDESYRVIRHLFPSVVSQMETFAKGSWNMARQYLPGIVQKNADDLVNKLVDKDSTAGKAIRMAMRALPVGYQLYKTFTGSGERKVMKNAFESNALSNYDIEMLVENEYNNWDDRFAGVICWDELKLPFELHKDDWGVIICTLSTTSNKNDIGHWVSMVIDNKKKVIMYYDSFGDEPKNLNKFINDIRHVKKYYDDKYELKINKVKNQKVTTSNCGYFAIYFLDNILRKKKTFKEATDFNSIEGEKKIDLMKKDFILI